MGALVTMQGANWLADQSVAAVPVHGSYVPGDWPAILDLCREAMPVAFPESLEGQAPPALPAAVETVARAFCEWCDHPVGVLKRTPVGQRASHLAVLPLGWKELVAEVLGLAVELVVRAKVPADDGGFPERARTILRAWRKRGATRLPGSRRYLARAATARGIPWRLLPAMPGIVQLGEGRRAVRFNASGSGRTRQVALGIAADKGTGNALLRQAGLPVPLQMRVDGADDVRRLVDRLGLPLVIKPTGLRLQQGVRFIYEAGQVDAAYAETAAYHLPIVAESYLPGPEHRVLVMDGRVIAAFERPSPHVVGDGSSTIQALVEAANAEPGRGSWVDGYRLPPVKLDGLSGPYLRSKGWSVDDVPPAGTVVGTHPLPFVGYGGGRRIDSTDRMHPDNHAVAVRALAVLGLDIGGIDFRTPDIGRSWKEVGAGICEVNPNPDLSAHYLPGLERDVVGIFLDARRPPGGRGWIPQLLLLGEDDPAPAAQAVADGLRRQHGWTVGVATAAWLDRDGLGREVLRTSLADAYDLLASDLTMDAIIYAASPAAVANEGLGTAHLDVVMANPGRTPAWGAAMQAADAAGARVIPLPAQAGAATAAAMRALAKRLPGGGRRL